MEIYAIMKQAKSKLQKLITLLFSFIGLIFIAFNTHAAVLTSIKPIAFITKAIADNVTETEVLLPDGVSPHTYALKPRDVQNIKSAELMIWISQDMETFLPNILRNIDANKQIELSQLPAINALLYRNETYHDHDHDHDHGNIDYHIWLSPTIAKKIAIAIHDKLLQYYPEKQVILDKNLNDFIFTLTNFEQVIAKNLINVENRRYFVFHDAYGYFERQFGLKNLGSFTINPDIQPGAQKAYHIRQQLVNNNAFCIFKEPQFNPAIIDKVIADTQVHVGTLDPLGMGIPLTKDAYFMFLTNLSEQYQSCLSSN